MKIWNNSPHLYLLFFTLKYFQLVVLNKLKGAIITFELILILKSE